MNPVGLDQVSKNNSKIYCKKYIKDEDTGSLMRIGKEIVVFLIHFTTEEQATKEIFSNFHNDIKKYFRNHLIYS